MPLEPLSADRLYTRCAPESFTFETTADLNGDGEFIGQGRAVDAIQFGIGMRHKGYNLFVMGPHGSGMREMITRHFHHAAEDKSPPAEWAYINNFDTSHQPRALCFPDGMAAEFAADMKDLVEQIQTALTTMFESEEYQTRRQELEEEVLEEQEQALEALSDKAEARNLRMVRTPGGLAFAPTQEGEIISPEAFQQLPEEERKAIQDAISELQKELQTIFQQRQRSLSTLQERIKQLDREFANIALNHPFKDMREDYAHHEDVLAFLDAVEADVLDNLKHFRPQADDGEGNPFGPSPQQQREAFVKRYTVNVIYDHDEEIDAPVIFENNPTYTNLMGRVEYTPRMGALTTDFTQIKAGALHRANGGYLILDARSVLLQPYAWEGLKRALESGEIRIETPAQMSGFISTTSLEPEPIPLNVKVALFGDRRLYYQLKALDPDFGELFKVAADFEEVITRDKENETAYADQIAQLIRENDLMPFDTSAVARVIERGARLASDSERLTINIQQMSDLLREADYWAGQAGVEVVSAEHVQAAVDAAIHRADRARERILETIDRDIVFIDTEGAVVGQVNGLAVLQLGDFAFGRPSRITASVRLGEGKVVDIEREVELSGPLHSKGVLILTGFLGERYAKEQPLSFAASLVFEQSYGGVDGDSASSTELYALLSALAGAPIKQGFAVTGSVNQKGEVQAIGGVNEKIEGFYDVCAERGLTGEQGVLIPAANIIHLMLRHDVVAAVAKGDFHIYAVETIDQGIEILTGVPAGERGEDGSYPAESINGRVQARLDELTRARAAFKENDTDA